MAGRATIRELLVKIGVIADTAKVAAMDAAMGKAKVAAMALAGVAIGAAAAVYKLTSSVAKARMATRSAGDSSK